MPEASPMTTEADITVVPIYLPAGTKTAEGSISSCPPWVARASGTSIAQGSHTSCTVPGPLMVSMGLRD